MFSPYVDPYGNLGFLLRPRPLPGPYPIFLAKSADIIKGAVSKYQLKPSSLTTPIETYLSMSQPSQMAEAGVAKIRIHNIRGGLRIPHLHYEDKIYLLSDEQWKEFSGQVIAQVQEKLANAKTVSFEQLMEVSEAVNVLA